MKKIIITLIVILILLNQNTTKNQITTLKLNNIITPKVYENIIYKYQEDYNNQDIIGELSIDKTDFLVPIVKSKDNQYYLTHDLYKKKNKLGSVFIDYRNNIDDKKIIIYGHNSKYIKTDFKYLENYLNETYFTRYSKITLKTLKNIYHYQVFSVIIVTDNFEHLLLDLKEEEYLKHLNNLKENSLYSISTDLKVEDEIIILQTCYYEPDESYLLIIGKKLK